MQCNPTTDHERDQPKLHVCIRWLFCHHCSWFQDWSFTIICFQNCAVDTHQGNQPRHYLICCFSSLGHATSNVQSCLPIIFQHQPISLKYSWLSVEQPIRFDWVLYRYHREFPIHKKMIPMLKCPILCFCLPALIFFSAIKAILKTTSIISNNVFKKRKENRRTKNARRKYKWGRNDLQVYR